MKSQSNVANMSHSQLEEMVGYSLSKKAADRIRKEMASSNKAAVK